METLDGQEAGGIAMNGVARCIAAGLFVALPAVSCMDAIGYETYGDKDTGALSNCETCHGEFKSGAVSPKGSEFGGGTKHDMHADMTLDRGDGGGCNKDACHQKSGETAGRFLDSSDEVFGCCGCHGRRRVLHHVSPDFGRSIDRQTAALGYSQRCHSRSSATDLRQRRCW